jgi:hypothetical protein
MFDDDRRDGKDALPPTQTSRTYILGEDELNSLDRIDKDLRELDECVLRCQPGYQAPSDDKKLNLAILEAVQIAAAIIDLCRDSEPRSFDTAPEPMDARLGALLRAIVEAHPELRETNAIWSLKELISKGQKPIWDELDANQLSGGPVKAAEQALEALIGLSSSEIQRRQQQAQKRADVVKHDALRWLHLQDQAVDPD